ncbi:hypothetical protein MOP89_06130 [Enterococcus gallinarum]|nr:hypothetical protein [Enterococcus gallinarum]
MPENRNKKVVESKLPANNAIAAMMQKRVAAQQPIPDQCHPAHWHHIEPQYSIKK